MKIDGAKLASDILSELKPEIKKLKQSGSSPTLAIVMIGNDKSSSAYIKQKKLKAEEIGINIKLFQYTTTTQEELEDTIARLNDDRKINGIIVQRPLPPSIKSETVSKLVNIEKDVDGFNDESQFDAPVASAVIYILDSIGESNLKRKKIVVIGKGETAGTPIIKLLDRMELNFEIIDSKTKKQVETIKNSDIIITAVGKKNIIEGKWLNKNQILIGVGLSLIDGKLIGDYEENDVSDRVKYFTPRIGGVGPINVALLMKNVVIATKNQAALSRSTIS